MPLQNINAEKIQGNLSITSVSATTYYNLPTSGGSFTGGTVTGPTTFTNGLTANTISATTYYNLPIDIYTTGGTYNNNTFTFTNNTGGTFSTLFNTLTGVTVNGDVLISGSSLPNGFALSVTGDTNFTGDVYVSGDITYNGNLLVTGGTIIQSGLTANTIYTDYIDFNTNYTGATLPAGRLQWDDGNGTLVLGLKGGLSNMEIGLENMALCYNDEATTLTAGTIVYVSGSQGNRPSIKRAIATGDGYSVTTLGVVSESIASGAEGFVTTFGMVNNLDTLGLSGGTALWLSPTVAGGYTNEKPKAPYHTVLIGYAVRIDNIVGSIFVHISNGWEIDELHDVRLNGRVEGDLLMLSGYNGSNVWVNSKTLNGSYTITGDTNIGGSLTASTISATTYYNLPTDIYTTGGTYSNGSLSFTNSTGGTFNINTSTNYAAGVISGATYTSDGSGQINLPAIKVALYNNANNIEPIIVYDVVSGTTGTGGIPALVDQDTNYIVVEYNGGSPRYYVYDNDGLVDDSSVVLFMIVYRAGNFVHTLEFGNQGAGLANKLNDRFIMTDRFGWESGLSLSLSASTGIVMATSGVAWNGPNRQSLTAVDSSGSTFFKNYHSGGTWTYTTTGDTINNSHYDNGTDIVSATAGKYLTNWYFRGQEVNSHLYEVYGNTEYDNVALAQLATEPLLPELITSHAILLGRIIIQVGASTGITESAFRTVFQSTQVTSHNDLTNLQGGTAGQYYHLTSNQYNNLALTNVNNNFSTNQTVNGDLIVTGNSTTTTLSATSVTADTITTFIPVLSPQEIYRGITFSNNSTTVTTFGGITMSTTASNLAISVSSTDFASKQIRLRYYSTTVSGGRYTGTRGSALLWYIHGGFRYVCDFRISDTSYASACQQFYGLAGSTADLTYGTVSLIQVSTLTNLIGVGNDGVDTNLQIIHNDSTGTATKIDLGANFPANRTVGAVSTTVYSVTLYNAPASNDVKYMVVNNETGAVAMGTISTNLPATTQGLNFFASRAMGGGGGVTGSGQFELSKLGVNSLL